MRSRVTIDDTQLENAIAFTGIQETRALLREALKSLIERETYQRSALLGSSVQGSKEKPAMRTTVALDDEQVEDAMFYTGITEKSALIREALTALIQREAARRLARLGGSDPNATAGPRRRPKF